MKNIIFSLVLFFHGVSAIGQVRPVILLDSTEIEQGYAFRSKDYFEIVNTKIARNSQEYIAIGLSDSIYTFYLKERTNYTKDKTVDIEAINLILTDKNNTMIATITGSYVIISCYGSVRLNVMIYPESDASFVINSRPQSSDNPVSCQTHSEGWHRLKLRSNQTFNQAILTSINMISIMN
jgi:hypothetical protein